MHTFDPSTSFGPDVAARYDDHPRGDEVAAVAFLSACAQRRPALEFAIGTGRIALPLAANVARYDPVTQLLTENHVRLTLSGSTMSPIVCRLITPGEMDLMARIAGLRLVERFASWQRTPFDAHSPAHVSVYGLSSGPS